MMDNFFTHMPLLTDTAKQSIARPIPMIIIEQVSIIIKKKATRYE
jgi:hypothetical protein